jgi:hypothetical protein
MLRCHSEKYIEVHLGNLSSSVPSTEGAAETKMDKTALYRETAKSTSCKM